jgi:hypothetical protein
MRWMQRFQTCIFGRVAAARKHLHVAILTDNDIQTRSDDEIATMISTELLAWRRRSLRPTPDFSSPGHGFILAVISQRIADAAPDSNLTAFANKLRELWGCRPSTEAVGEIFWENLYLQHPTEQRFWKFTFSVDFFGAQGDGRWWHDHRAPGGLLFTANSVGHMRKYRELYEGKSGNQNEWVIQSAMKTIFDAAETTWGRATWLKPLDSNGFPVVRGTPCPFAQPVGVRGEMSAWDWTRYGGFLHSDHSIRPEFFSSNPAPSDDITREEFLQDFTYLYDKKLRDHATFMGVEVTSDEVFAVLKPIEEWTAISRSRQVTTPRSATKAKGAVSTLRPTPRHLTKSTISGAVPSTADRARLTRLLARSAKWQLSPSELDYLDV